jgi:DNA-binding CsgD family transcriptional regulator
MDREVEVGSHSLYGKSLSKREEQILREISKGASDGEIAETLCLSRNTVKNHVLRAREKLGAKNRTHAAVLWIFKVGVLGGLA